MLNWPIYQSNSRFSIVYQPHKSNTPLADVYRQTVFFQAVIAASLLALQIVSGQNSGQHVQ